MPKGLNEVTTFAQIKSPPLSALVAFIRTYCYTLHLLLGYCPELLNSKVIKRLVPLLAGVLYRYSVPLLSRLPEMR